MNPSSHPAIHQVQLQLSHPVAGDGTQGARLRVLEAASRLTVLEMDIPPESFYKLLAGFVDSETLPAQMLPAHLYLRVGKPRHQWSKRIGHGVTQQEAERWAAAVGLRYGMHSWHVDSRQGGLYATWKMWVDMDEATDQELSTIILGESLPEGAK